MVSGSKVNFARDYKCWFSSLCPATEMLGPATGRHWKPVPRRGRIRSLVSRTQHLHRVSWEAKGNLKYKNLFNVALSKTYTYRNSKVQTPRLELFSYLEEMRKQMFLNSRYLPALRCQLSVRTHTGKNSRFAWFSSEISFGGKWFESIRKHWL